jgi:hypothetical protein
VVECGGAAVGPPGLADVHRSSTLDDLNSFYGTAVVFPPMVDPREVLDAYAHQEFLAEPAASCPCRPVATRECRWCLSGQERYQASFGPLCVHVAAKIVERAALRCHSWAPGEEAYMLGVRGLVAEPAR